MGRADKPALFIKRGCTYARIEIELHDDDLDAGSVTITRVIAKKSKDEEQVDNIWYIDGTPGRSSSYELGLISHR